MEGVKVCHGEENAGLQYMGKSTDKENKVKLTNL